MDIFLSEREFSMNYRESGHGEVPLVLIHGFPFNHVLWTNQLSGLKKDTRVIAPDIRGMGDSSLPDQKLGEVTSLMSDVSEDIMALLEELRVDQVVLGALSMGGYVAWEFLKKHKKMVKGLILFGTNAGTDTNEQAAARRMTALRVEKYGLEFLSNEMIGKLLSEDTRKNRMSVVETVHNMILRNTECGVAALARGMAVRKDAHALLPKIKCPTLILTGADDIISPVEQMEEMSKKIPGSEIKVIPGAGHLPPLETPDVVNTAIREFLGRL